MIKVHKDDTGLFIIQNDEVVRAPAHTAFKEGDEVEASHFENTKHRGVGKDRTCRKGEWLEVWSSK